MSKINRSKLTFPEIVPFKAQYCPSSIAYIGAAGFEQRAFSIPNILKKKRIKVDSAIAITYLPFDLRNKTEKFGQRLKELTSSISWIVYDRHDPQKFQNSFSSLVPSLSSKSILIDISAMSKMLIMILLQSFRKVDKEIIIAYAEARVYHPTVEEFKEAKGKIKETPDFLTSDVFKILHVTSLSSSAMQGYPILLIAYPTFNHNEIVALHNELSPNCMLLILGRPHERHNKWRLNAVREINNKVMNDPDYCRETIVLSTFDYLQNIIRLESIYEKYKYTHRILLAPTGSKFQTVACFMFKQMHPDVQIVYPATRAFSGDYTNGSKALWCIRIANLSELVSQLDQYRRFA